MRWLTKDALLVLNEIVREAKAKMQEVRRKHSSPGMDSTSGRVNDSPHTLRSASLQIQRPSPISV